MINSTISRHRYALRLVEDRPYSEATMTFVPLIITVFSSVALLLGAHWILIGRHPEIGNERLFARYLAMLGLTIACVVGTALTLPVGESSRNQLIGLIGY